MSDFSLWVTGVALTGTVIVAAAITYIWYSFLRIRLPLAVRYRDLEGKVLDLEGQASELKEEVERKREDLKSLLQEKMQAELEIGDARAWLEKNQDKLEQLEFKRQEVARVEQELAGSKQKLQEVQEELLTAQAQRLDEAEKAAAARRDVESLGRELSEIQSRKSGLESDTKKLQEQERALKINLGKLEIEQKRAEDQLDRLRSEIAQAEKKAEDQLARLQSEITKGEKSLESLRSELNGIRAEQRKAEQARDEAVAVKGSLDREIKVKEKAASSMQDMLGRLGDRIDDFSQTIKPPSGEERLEDFKRDVLTLDRVGKRQRKVDGAKGEDKSFRSFEKYVEESGFVFHPRTLRAFHTSLKSADISPLVVLAGISGTGKSQLPRLYAEAMGMHFLNVSVQPRWDAPQDLFGFYNYMEHRYKATELSRALRQMDSCNWPIKDGAGKLIQTGMLLVLLDEMNLARVEYYFSELLSKLEMRDKSRIGDPTARQISEIEIEMGSLESAEKPRRLFVGFNVLFAGTMNEDETTQALSAKVVDRANVLRFGKPRKTRGEAVTEQPERPADFITHDDWSSWCGGALKDDEQERLEGYCTRMNQALASIYRPFGHRVHQAIQAYIANYPKLDANWFDHALSDQLEQKIIPKLAGVSEDTEMKAPEALEELQHVIEELGDEALTQTFRLARELPVFQWTGVNRESFTEKGPN